ncbi:hypothetical protein [Pimelobacter simplex]|uniref:hypothetical protein n=1 Tax=Nocardioides simplex TaxID=2045 RepID=UPI003AAA7539
MALATWQEVAVALGRPSDSLTPEQQGQITYWLNGVELHLKARLGPIADLDPDTVKYVETEIAAAKARPLLAGGGASSISVSVDDGTVTRRYDPVTAADITDDLWGLFGPGVTATGYTIVVRSPQDIA